MVDSKKKQRGINRNTKYFLLGLWEVFASPFTLFFPTSSIPNFKQDDTIPQAWKNVNNSLWSAIERYNLRDAGQHKPPIPEYKDGMPPPSMLAAYENKSTGAADRILTMAEQESKYMISCELEALSYLKQGQKIATILFTLLIIMGLVAYLIYQNTFIVLALVLSLVALGVVGTFVSLKSGSVTESIQNAGRD